MERIGGENTGMPTSIRKVVASFIGTTIEWYDYFIFVTSASLTFPDVFPGFGEGPWRRSSPPPCTRRGHPPDLRLHRRRLRA